MHDLDKQHYILLPSLVEQKWYHVMLSDSTCLIKFLQITILLEAGADRMIPDLKGMLPSEAANEHGYIQCR